MTDMLQVAPTVTTRRSSVSPSREPAADRLPALLWKRKGLILAGMAVPALLTAGILLALPQKHAATLAYECPMAESEYSVLVRRFYSRENLDRIAEQFRQRELHRLAQQFESARTEASVEKLIRLKPLPKYPERVRTTDPETSEQISALLAPLLSLQVTASAGGEIAEAASVVGENFEQVLPIYEARKRLRDSIKQFKTQAAEIESDRFLVQLELQQEEARLEKLKDLDAGPSEDAQGITLEFADVQNSREFLPLSYQVRAAESKIIDLQEKLAADAKRLDYYLRVVALADRLLNTLEDRLVSHYTISQYLGFLAEQLASCEDEAIAEYLRSHMRRTEALVLANTRAGEKPAIYPVSQHLSTSGALASLLGLMLALLMAVLLEQRQKRKKTSAPPVESEA